MMLMLIRWAPTCGLGDPLLVLANVRGARTQSGTLANTRPRAPWGNLSACAACAGLRPGARGRWGEEHQLPGAHSFIHSFIHSCIQFNSCILQVFDQALAGGGAKNINFQELAADLAQITFDYPFRIPPYFALIIRAISVLEGIALVGNPEFALVDEAYPYIAKRLLTDESPRLRDALRYMVYGKSNVFDADRVIDLLAAFEDYTEASQSARGDMDKEGGVGGIGGGIDDARARLGRGGAFTSTMPDGSSEDASTSGRAPLFPPFPFPFPFPLPGGGGGGANGGFGGGGFPQPVPSFMMQVWELSPVVQVFKAAQAQSVLPAAMPMGGAGAGGGNTREALRFILSPQGTWFREFVMDELVKSVDALSRDQIFLLVQSLGLQNAMVPVLLPGASRSFLPLAPTVTDEDRQVVANMTKIVDFLTRGQNLGDAASNGVPTREQIAAQQAFLSELLPVLPTVATEVVPQLAQRLASRIGARLVRELFSQAVERPER
jgi:aarF domain-containing kinase